MTALPHPQRPGDPLRAGVLALVGAVVERVGRATRERAMCERVGREDSVMLVLAYLGAIIAANMIISYWGPGATIVTAFLWIALDFTLKDSLQQKWQGRWLLARMAALILAGSALTYLLNSNAGQIAIASVISFAISLTADSLVFQRLIKHPWFLRCNGSNVAGAALDSLIFPRLAFPGMGLVEWMAVAAGQWGAKVGGGFLWSVVLARR